MPRPEWLDRERYVRSCRWCNTCRHVGKPVGYTNRLSDGRHVMYQCALHPTIRLWRDTLACQDYERGDNGIEW